LPDPKKPPMIVTGIGEKVEWELFMNVPLIILCNFCCNSFIKAQSAFISSL